MTVLPRGWATAPIRDLCTLINGRAFKPTEWRTTGLPIIRIQNLNNAGSKFNYFDGSLDPKHEVNPGDLLFAWSGTPGTSFGAHVWNGPRAALNQHIFRVQFDRDHLDRDFFRLAINHRLDELIAAAHGGAGLAHVTKPVFEATEILVPPLAEQRRIVARIEALTARSRRAKEALDAIPPLLEKFRQSVLAAAFRGELGSDALPPGWYWRTLGELCTDGPRNGYSPKTGPDARGTLSLKLSATTQGRILLSDEATKRIYETVDPGSDLWLRKDDVLIQRANSLDYLGVAALFDGPERTFIYPDLMMRLRFDDSILARYVWRYINSDSVRRYFRDSATGTAGNMPKINGATVRSLRVPVPPSNDLKRIVHRLDAAIASIDTQQRALALANEKLGAIDRSILSRAFRGELVPQDPADEPAAVLLERIRAERAASTDATAPRTSRTRMKARTDSVREQSSTPTREPRRASR